MVLGSGEKDTRGGGPIEWVLATPVSTRHTQAERERDLPVSHPLARSIRLPGVWTWTDGCPTLVFLLLWSVFLITTHQNQNLEAVGEGKRRVNESILVVVEGVVVLHTGIPGLASPSYPAP